MFAFRIWSRRSAATAGVCRSSLGRADDIYAMFIMCFGHALSLSVIVSLSGLGCYVSIVATPIIHATFCLAMGRLGVSASVGGRGCLGVYVPEPCICRDLLADLPV